MGVNLGISQPCFLCCANNMQLYTLSAGNYTTKVGRTVHYRGYTHTCEFPVIRQQQPKVFFILCVLGRDKWR